ncbi:MAG: glucose-1-phosphate adenylyltransferase [Calditrichaeota bacterium]|nr:MAG: glucose-1-phosphate adenylyltransferase [Calditrichota bacterium]
MSKVVVMILAGGQGTRLYPLTKYRSKPAVPIAGKFRLIDIPISNCLNSDYRRIFICTQFAAESLHRHIFLTYRFSIFARDFVTILSAQQTPENRDWYQGTADAVRQNLNFIREEDEHVLILSGDHLYRMDYSKFVQYHIDKDADITIAVIPVTAERAPQFGIMKVEEDSRITEFYEKPRETSVLDNLRVPAETFRHHNIDPRERTHLASMGIYVFNPRILRELLEGTKYSDFGKEVIPFAISRKKVYAYFFDGYWEDIGTIRSFFEAHIDLTRPLPKFNFYDEENPIYSHPRFLPGAKVLESTIVESILCDGSIIDRGSNIRNSIVGIRSIVGENTTLEEVVMMGADYFETPEKKEQNRAKGIPHIGIGNNCHIRRAIIDKNARIGNNVKIINEKNLQDHEDRHYVIRDGIVVIPKRAIIPDGTVI